MLEKLEEIKGRYQELASQLGDPEIAANPREYQKIAKEYGRLKALVEAYDRHTEVTTQIAENEVLATDDDEAMAAMAAEELETLRAEQEKLEEEIRELLIPPDPMDEKDIFIEVRAGTGGEEAALFARDLFRMYARYAEKMGWKVNLVDVSETDHGGFKEVVAEIHGDDVYSHLKYEKGTHRVQRVPETESQGRIHTSAVTVAVLPEVDDVEVDVDPSDLRIDTFRASGAGGQHVNKTESAVRITHEPTGLVVSCQDEKSQHKNKSKAMKVLKSRLYEQQLAAQQAEEAAARREQIGSGDRSERIRTYNFPQNRISDHRINLTLYNLDQVIEGELSPVVEPLRAHYRAEALKELGAN
jgi:peptide chain release factor 1